MEHLCVYFQSLGIFNQAAISSVHIMYCRVFQCFADADIDAKQNLAKRFVSHTSFNLEDGVKLTIGEAGKLYTLLARFYESNLKRKFGINF